MTPQTILAHCDSGKLWTQPAGNDTTFDVAAAYQSALAVRELRVARGEIPRGFKIGFTNQSIWPRYGVCAPIWGTVYDTTLTFCDDHGVLTLTGSCQPRIEPEAVFCMKSKPAENATLEDLFGAIDWVAAGFEVVQSHLLDWKFKAADTVADGGLHAHLLVGRRVPVGHIATSVNELNDVLAATQVTLMNGEQIIEEGCGANVLGSPLLALHHFLAELRLCPGAPDLKPGDVVTTGTWTDAWPIESGQCWTGAFSSPLATLSVDFR